MQKLLLELATGNALEHSYRPALKDLFESLDPSVRAVNEPSRSKYGAPDFAFYKAKNSYIALGYVETKDLTVDLDSVEKSEQLKRYLGYANLILTNYIEFRFFRNGVKYQTITIGRRNNTVISPLTENYSQLEREIKAFLEGEPETITNAKRLAEIMGGKAARVRDNVLSYFKEENGKNEELLRIYKVMQELLVQDLTKEKFADMYAQTLVYGLFVARYYDETPENFTRQEARDLIPASNPFLQHFFDHIVGPKFDRRLTYIVDELCDVFSVSAVQEIIAKHYNLFGEVTDKDPIIHFYEDFLKEYDPSLRKKMGAYYTPVAVVNFIISAVDEILKKDFNLHQGLADTTKIERNIMQQGTKAKEVLHKVQILDPAVGTATFLNETIKFIYQRFKGQEGVWKSYVEKELLPRLFGFELMMAPYTIAHLKLAMTLKETGIDYFGKRLGVYLTNTLEEGIKVQQDMFSQLGLAGAITEESKSANVIKHDRPIMVIIGNPPYNNRSTNKGKWVQDLIKDYKNGLNEKKINLDDDYIKFIRFSEHFIEKNEKGIVAMITNNSFLDGITHRQMRKHLLETFDSIYILNLHGNSNIHEESPDGIKDDNVFDIQQGVSINIFVKTSKRNKNTGAVHYADMFGKRDDKLQKLMESNWGDIAWDKLKYSEPYYFFVPKDFGLEKEYTEGFKLDELFIISNSGVKTDRDSLFIDQDKSRLKKRLKTLISREFDESFRKKYRVFDSGSYKLSKKIEGKSFNEKFIKKVLYRPFDYQWIYYDPSVISRPGIKVFKHFNSRNNIGLLLKRQSKHNFSYVYLTNILAESCVFESAYANNTVFPLYTYVDDGSLAANIKKEIIHEIERFVGDVSPEHILNYIYALLHSSVYREKYKEFLKIDFPRIPYPKEKKSFRLLVGFGEKLRSLHLMEDSDLESLITTYPAPGDNLVEKVEYHGGSVWINDEQYFGNVPKEAWEFFIGGYQPAQKWLKDRKGRILTYEDITHYQKIIKSLFETIEVQKKIDELYSSIEKN